MHFLNYSKLHHFTGVKNSIYSHCVFFIQTLDYPQPFPRWVPPAWHNHSNHEQNCICSSFNGAVNKSYYITSN
jgi:hypothetical protein